MTTGERIRRLHYCLLLAIRVLPERPQSMSTSAVCLCRRQSTFRVLIPNTLSTPSHAAQSAGYFAKHVSINSHRVLLLPPREHRRTGADLTAAGEGAKSRVLWWQGRTGAHQVCRTRRARGWCWCWCRLISFGGPSPTTLMCKIRDGRDIRFQYCIREPFEYLATSVNNATTAEHTFNIALFYAHSRWRALVTDLSVITYQ